MIEGRCDYPTVLQVAPGLGRRGIEWRGLWIIETWLPVW